MTKKGLKQFEVATKNKKERDEFSVSNSIPLTPPPPHSLHPYPLLAVKEFILAKLHDL